MTNLTDEELRDKILESLAKTHDVFRKKCVPLKNVSTSARKARTVHIAGKKAKSLRAKA
jgi:hypothetical protein